MKPRQPGDVVVLPVNVVRPAVGMDTLELEEEFELLAKNLDVGEINCINP